MKGKTAHLFIDPRNTPPGPGRCCCGGEQHWVYWRNRKEVGNCAPVFRRPAWLETIIVRHPPEDRTHKPIQPFEPCVNNCRRCPVDVDIRRQIRADTKGGGYTRYLCHYGGIN